MPEPGTTPRTTPRRAPVNRYEYERRERKRLRRPSNSDVSGAPGRIEWRCFRRASRIIVEAAAGESVPSAAQRPPTASQPMARSASASQPAILPIGSCTKVFSGEVLPSPVLRWMRPRLCTSNTTRHASKVGQEARPGEEQRRMHIHEPGHRERSAHHRQDERPPEPRQHQPHRGGDESDGKARPWRRVGRTHHCRPSHLSCLPAAPGSGKGSGGFCPNLARPAARNRRPARDTGSRRASRGAVGTQVRSDHRCVACVIAPPARIAAATSAASASSASLAPALRAAAP